MSTTEKPDVTTTIDPRELRKALGSFLTGVTLVTTMDQGSGEPRGMTANSFTSVSLEPPLILVCIGTHANSFDSFNSCSSFAVNIVGEGQQDLASRFASRRDDKFSDTVWTTKTSGAPIIDGSLAWLDCTVHSREMVGDHLVLIGRVEAFDSSSGRPLAFNRGSFATLGLEAEMLAKHVSDPLRIGWIAEFEQGLLLVRDETGWSLPSAPLKNSNRDKQPDSVAEMHASDLRSMGMNVKDSLLYSVVEQPSDGSVCMYYRTLLGADSTPAVNEVQQLFAFDEIPWDQIGDRHIRNMLRRYIQERLTARFGIYVGSESDGQVLIVGSSQEWREQARQLQGIELAESVTGGTADHA